ncbi:hypothetical protein N7495_006303 [Penicillium taxi]|uniref:uncharacterized protein n=1 Tax=Penicillium taxi TaxID=168475 RepID=UPI002545495D|nr:uncharacterized protein N7495_006303 [Penicillium taxi]KAJ5894612.1 hypothetical protein N7495_006303 [Penicillium taxi]
MGGRNVIFTAEPKNLQTMLALKFNDFEVGKVRIDAGIPLVGFGIFSLNGKQWEHSRALLRPNFVRAQVTNTRVYETHFNELLENIPRDKSTVDLQILFNRLTLDTATEFLFGESAHSLKKEASPSGLSFGKSFDNAQNGLADRFRLGVFMKFYRNKEYSDGVIETRAYAGKFAQKAIDYRLAVTSGNDVPQDIKELTEKQYVFSYELSKQTLDKEEMIDQMISILLAGRDTTANLLSITFFVLSRRTDVWNKLRESVLALNGEKPSFEDLKSMTYLTWVLNEILRLYPIAPFNTRMAKMDTFLPRGGGPSGKDPLFVPKGYEVMYSVYSMHRLPEFFGQDADEFRPERWEKLRPGWAYLPFNGGPRICIGQQFSLTEASYTIVRMLQEFKAIESHDPEPFVEGLVLVLTSANGTKVGLTLA